MGSAVVRWWGGETQLFTTPPPHHRTTSCTHFKNTLHLHRNITWQRAHANSAARADAGIFAEDVGHQFRKAVDDRRLLFEVGGAIDHAERLDQALDLVERAECVAHRGEDGEADGAGRFFALL